MRTLALVALGIGLAALAFLFLSSVGVDEPRPMETLPERIRPDGTEEIEAASAPETSAPNTSTAPEPAPERAAVASDPLAQLTGVPRALRVHLVDGESGADVAFGSVWTVPPVDPARITADPSGGTGLRARVAGIEPAARGGAGRRIDLPRPDGPCWILGGTDVRFGAVLWRGDLAEIDLPVYGEPLLQAIVVDANGTPRPFVPVELGVLRASGSGWGLARVSAPPGDTRITIPDVLWRIARAEATGSQVHGLALVPDVVLLRERETKTVPLPLAPVTAEPIRVVTPPCGPLRVRVTQSDGTPWPFQGRVTLDGWFVGAPLEGGEAKIPAVLSAPPLHVLVKVFDPNFPPQVVDVPGEREPWIETTLDVRLPAPGAARPLLVGTLLEQDGRPAANRTFAIVAARRSGVPVDGCGAEPRKFTTGGDGAFQVPYGDDGAVRTRAIHPVPDPPTRNTQFDPTERALLELPPNVPGTYDVGTLRLAPVACFVSGRVSDAKGAPVPGVSVAIRMEEDPRGIPMTGDDTRPWPADKPRELTTTSKPDGSFAFYVSTEAKRGVAALRGHRQPDRVKDVAFEAGARDVVLKTAPFSRVAGNLLLDLGLPSSALTVVLKHEGRAIASFISGARFDVQVDASGTYVLSIEARATRGVLFSIPDLDVPEGAPCDDPRLENIDLRGRLFVRHITVLDPDGSPVARAEIRATADSGASHCVTDPSGVATLVTDKTFSDLVVAASGRREAYLVGVDGDRTVTLQRGIPIRVRLAAGADAPAALQVCVSRALPPRSIVPAVRWPAPTSTFTDGVATLALERPDRYRVILFVHPPGQPLRQLESATVEVDVIESGAECTIEASASMLRAFVDGS